MTLVSPATGFKPSRRSVLAGTAATAGAFSFGFSIPLAGEALAQGATPEVNAWVVIHPDDKVVIRIARSEMGQGTLTGLAQLVAEELNCDWTKVTTEYPTPGQNLARNRVWGNFSTGGSRGIRESHEYVRKGGAAARMMLVQAAANEWKVPVAECAAENSVVSHKASGRSLRYGQLAAAAAKIEPPKDVPLKDPKRLDHRRQAAGAAGHGRQDQWQEDLRHGSADAGHAERRDQGLPGLRRQGEELRCGGGQVHARRQACAARRRQRRGGRRRFLVAGQDRARCAADRLG